MRRFALEVGPVAFVATALLVLALGCEEHLAMGDRCERNGECPAPLVCGIGRCRSECLTSRDCVLGAWCVIDPDTELGVCSLEDRDRCDSEACALGLVCLEGTAQCVSPCGSVVACPDGVCEENICVPAREVADAGVPDAAVPPDAAGDGSTPIDGGAECHGPRCDPVRQLAIGWATMFAVTESGVLWAWGSSDYDLTLDGRLEHEGCAACAPRPVQPLDRAGEPFEDVLEVDAGNSHACALREDRTVWCWGAVWSLGLGVGSPPSIVPVQVQRQEAAGFEMLDDVDHIVSGRFHMCAVRRGEVWCWGSGMQGAIGTGNTSDQPRAVRATELPGSPDRMVSTFGTTMILVDGVASGVGENVWRQLGAESPSGTALTRVSSALTDVTQVAMSADSTCAIRSDGELGCWGRFEWGDSGIAVDCGGGELCSETWQRILRPSAVRRWAGLAADRRKHYVFAWGDDGVLYGFGFGSVGVVEPGNDRVIDPVRRAGLSDPVASVALAQDSVCAATRAGDVYCWGEGSDGQLGDGTFGPGRLSDTPTLVAWPD